MTSLNARDRPFRRAVARDTAEWRVRVIPHHRSEVDTDAPTTSWAVRDGHEHGGAVSGRKVAEAAIQETHSPAAQPAQLRDLVLCLESGTISESEFDQAEGEIARRLSMAGLAGRDARL